MGSKLGEFLESFSDDGKIKKQVDQQMVEQRVLNQENEQTLTEDELRAKEMGLRRTVERVVVKGVEPEQPKQQPLPQKHVELQGQPEQYVGKSLRLNLGRKKNQENVEKSQLVSSVEQEGQIQRQQPLPQRDELKEVQEVEDLEALFQRSGTPLDQRDKWLLTIERARGSKQSTMLNKKVCAGKFRFTSVGELEILPDMDTSGKTSKELLGMKWQ